MQAKSIKAISVHELEEVLVNSITENFKPTLAIVFASISEDLNTIAHLFNSQSIHTFGATTNGQFIDEGFDQETIVALLLDLNQELFRVYCEEYKEITPREASQRIAKAAVKEFSNPAFLIAGCHLATDAEQLLYGFEDVIGKDVNVYGAMAGDNFSFTETFAFTDKKVTNQGVVSVALDASRIEILGRASCGWKPMGTEKMVTKSEGNRVYTIEGMPALDITAKYGGIENLSPDNEDLMMEIATNCALQLQREKGDPVMRPGLMVNWDDHSFYCSGTVPQGSKVRFSLPPDFDAIEEVINGCKEIKRTSMPEADALIYFSCAGRLVAFGPVVSEEIKGVREVWNVPMVGFFSNAELARATGGNLEMHNLTSCCVVLKEK